jgi:hypothetical protein
VVAETPISGLAIHCSIGTQYRAKRKEEKKEEKIKTKANPRKKYSSYHIHV